MSLQWPAPLFTSGGQNASGTYVGFTTAQPVGLPVFESPIPSTTAEYLFRQPFMQFRANFTPTALGTPHPSSGLTPDYSTYFLVNEGDRRDIEGGLVRWIRTYAIKPASHDEPESYPGSFFGYLGTTYAFLAPTQSTQGGYQVVSTITGRPRFTRTVDCRVQHDYFIAGPSGGGLVTPDYSTPFDIPVYPAQVSRAGLAGFPGDPNPGIYVDYVGDETAGIVPTVPPLHPDDGASHPNPAETYNNYSTWVTNAVAGFSGSDPIPTLLWSSAVVYTVGALVYRAFVAGVSVTKFFICKLAVGPSATPPESDGTHWTQLVLPGQMIAEDSRLSRWNGNIFLRQTRFILAI